MHPFRLAAILLVLSLGVSAETLTIVSWGGAYEHSQTEAYFKPFTQKTGIEITVESYNGGIIELQAQVKSGTPNWDLVDLVVADNIEACELGLLEKIDHKLLIPAPDGTIAEKDFLPGTLTPCGVGQIVSATVLAFNDGAFPGKKPSSITDLFDLTTFPGKRGLQRKPIAILEWALLSYGVPIADLYSLLSTQRGIKLAFERLDQIKKQILWWEVGSDPAKMLASGDVVMSSGYNGRLFDAAVNQHLPIEIIWQGQLVNYSTWGIPKGAPNSALAHEFVRFATTAKRLSDQTKYIAYGPARVSSAQGVRKHLASGIDLRPHLPTYPPNMEHAIVKDQRWYAKTQSRMLELFEQWISEPVPE